MGLTFAQPLALWGLLGLPVIVLIHFLQSRNRRAEVSTLFLLERLPEETRRGAVFTYLRNGWQLWLQLLAVLLFTLLLARPMWLHAQSVQQIAVVVDTSASMQAFRDAWKESMKAAVNTLDSAASHTDWLVLPSEVTAPLIYRGDSVEDLLAALEEVAFIYGDHPVRPALTDARRLVGPKGLMLFVTDQIPEALSSEAVALGVGNPQSNTGFTGIRFERREDGLWSWEASGVHFGLEPVEREVSVSIDGRPGASQTIQTVPGGVFTIQGVLPPNAEQGRLALPSDGFPADDVLPFVVPRPKPLPFRTALQGEQNDWARRVMATVPGSVEQDNPVLVWLPSGPAELQERTPAEIRLGSEGETAPYAPLIATDHDLTRDLSWSGFLGQPLTSFNPAPGEIVLLWMGDIPLVTLLERKDTRRLTLNFRLEDSNAERFPAMILLIHRFADRVRQAQDVEEWKNLETLQRVDLAVENKDLQVKLDSLDGETEESLTEGVPFRAPGKPGIWTIRKEEETVLKAGVSFGQIEEADLREADSRDLPGDLTLTRQKRNSRTDVGRSVWFTLLGLVLLGTWWTGAKEGGV